MKIDKIMEIAFRIICGVTAVIVIVGFCVSCVGKPIKACAISPADPTQWAGMVDQWRDDYENNLTTTLKKINQGLANGDIDAATQAGKEYLAVQALQVAALNNPAMSTTLHAVDMGLATIPDFSEVNSLPSTMTISGTSASGIYRSALDDQIHVVTLLEGLASGEYRDFTATCAVSDEFDYTVTYTQESTWDRNVNVTDSYVRNGFSTVSWDTVWMWGDITVAANNYFYGYSGTIDNNSQGMSPCRLYFDSLPNDWVLERTMNYNPITTSKVMGYSGVSVTLPTATVDTEEPWNYYNDIVLPYIQQNYPNITNEYLVFPQGYTPAPAPDPTEPATFPNGGIYIDKQFNIGVNIIFPTDASGQPVTDEQGETVTETVYITDTSPLDGEYNFKMPTLAHLNIYDATLPNPDISSYSDGIGFIWTACYNILTESGFMPVVMICFALALFGFILWKLGG